MRKSDRLVCAACRKRLYTSNPFWMLSNGMACCVSLECYEMIKDEPRCPEPIRP